ncbi:MAG TPA: elongation factor 4 [Erysipelotrichaceae bacterium]|nr:elongation factor 4 [Erysipelotrichaceae bacterium]
MNQKFIRNFSIIAHIDHGKSTLADRILEMTKTVENRDMMAQILDTLDLERERGITIKLNAVQLKYTAKDNQEYVFHLIDTPGHVDFTYEVSRSLAACEGAVLVVDAAQGIEAQTLANVYLALDNDLEIIPVINKVDLPAAEPQRVIDEIENVIGLAAQDAPQISAKSGLNVEQVLEAVVRQVPPPQGDPDAPLKALVFDSYYDPYRGVIAFVRIKEGNVKVGDKIQFMQAKAVYEVVEVGIRTPKEMKKSSLSCGEVGWIAAGIKSVKDVHVGDTITHQQRPALSPLPGYRILNSMVFCGLYPVETNRYNDLREALEKLQLNDAALKYEPETSQALGFGFRCGFLGLLHMDVVQERLEREYNLQLIATAPSVVYHAYLTDGSMIKVDNPSLLPESQRIDHLEEPYVKATIMVPTEYVGAVMELAQKKRGIYQDMIAVDASRMHLIYHLPLGEIVFDFFDRLKSSTRGYASFDYEFLGYLESRLVKMDILLNAEVVDALSTIVHRDFAYARGKAITEKLRTLIPRQQFEIPVQAALNHKIIARSDIKALRKNVLAKCYGGDISRKKKLLEKQKEGKKRMKQVGNVEIPQEAFMAVLSMDDE